MTRRLIAGALALARARSLARRPWHGALVASLEQSPPPRRRRAARRPRRLAVGDAVVA